jgi:hypothetical protein
MTIVEESIENKQYFQLDPDFMDILTRKQRNIVPKENIIDGYKTITVYVKKIDNRKLPIGKITLNNEYIVNGKTVIPREITDGNKYMCEVKDEETILFLELEEFRKRLLLKQNLYTVTSLMKTMKC